MHNILTVVSLVLLSCMRCRKRILIYCNKMLISLPMLRGVVRIRQSLSSFRKAKQISKVVRAAEQPLLIHSDLLVFGW